MTSSFKNRSWWGPLRHALRQVLFYVWGTLGVDLIINTIANVTTMTTDTQLSKLLIIRLAATFPIPVLTGLFFLVLLTIFAWTGREYNVPPGPSPDELNRAHMLGRLHLSYHDLMEQSLQETAWLKLDLAEKPGAVRTTANLSLHMTNQVETPLPPGTSITEVYDKTRCELLILGEPGAGKSTLLLDLAQQLLTRAGQDAIQPLPVILPLSSWAIKRLPLQDWMSEQLLQMYDVPRKVGERWIGQDGILPLLDGLDEMEENARAECIDAINTYHRDHLAPLVICSRTAEYAVAAQRHRLVLHGAVVVQPLTYQHVDSYLAQEGEPLTGLRTAIRENEALREMVTTPLMLSVLILTYRGVTSPELPSKRTQLQKEIWETYVKHMVERKEESNRYWSGGKSGNNRHSLENTRTWLSWLARQMERHNLTVFYIEQMQPDWLPTRQVYEWCAVRLPGFLLGMLLSLLVGVLFSNSFDPAKLMVYGVIGGYTGGLFSQALLGKQAVGQKKSLRNRARFLWSIVSGLTLPLIASLLLGFIIGLGAWFTIGQAYSDGCDLRPDGAAITRLSSDLSSLVLPMFFHQTYADGCDLLHNGFITGFCGILSILLINILFYIFKIIVIFYSFLSKRRGDDRSSFNPPSQLHVGIGHIGNGILVGCSVGLIFGLVTWQAFKQEHGMDYGAIFGVHDGLITYGLIFILISILLSITIERMSTEIRPTEILKVSWPNLSRSLRNRKHLVLTLGVAVSFAVGIGLASGLSTFFTEQLSEHTTDIEARHTIVFASGLGDGLTYGLTFGVAYWLLLGLYKGLSSEVLSEEARSKPNEGIMRSLYNGMGMAIWGGLIIGVIGILSTMLYFGLHAGVGQGFNIGPGLGLSAGSNSVFNTFDLSNIWPSAGLVVGIQAGLFGAPLACMLMGGLACFRHFVLRLFLYRSHKIPYDYPGFLDRAAECILLRKIGGGYMFIHREFQDYMASLDHTIAEKCPVCGYLDNRSDGQYCPSCGAPKKDKQL